MEAPKAFSERSARIARLFGAISLICPTTLVVMWLLFRAGWVRFHDDYYGYGALFFLMVCAGILLPTGVLAGGIALRTNRGAWLSRLAALINILLLIACFSIILPRML